MPPLPKAPPKGHRTTPLDDPKVAQAIVLVLEGHSTLNGQASGAQPYVHFARAVRRWMEERPAARRAFLKWFEAL